MRTRRPYQQCARCIMDTSEPDIQFDENGECNHCKRYDERARHELFYNESGRRYLENLADGIKEKQKHKEYDCLIGLSGGVDSTMVAYLVKQLGLRPLAVHLDNGWDSELAVQNIERILKTLDIDLHTHVVDWEVFKDLHRSFLKASIANSEIPTDHAILAVLYRVAVQHGIRYIISGGNLVTEAIMPSSWMYDANDYRFIKSVHKKYGQIKLETFPYFTLPHFIYWTFIKGIRFFPILNYVPFNKKEAIGLLERELGWRSYGGKHYESIYTRFFQGYILPHKFNIDKRLAHFSTLICSGQMTREEAMAEMEHDPYSPGRMEEDKQYVIKKLDLTPEDFATIMAEPVKTHLDYASNNLVFHKMPNQLSFIKKIASSRPSLALDEK